MLLGKMDEPLEEQMGSMIVCGKFCSGVMSTSPLPSCDKHQSFLFDETSRQGIYDNWVPFAKSIYRQRLGVQRSYLHVFALFQVPTAQNNQCAKVACFVVAYSATLHQLRQETTIKQRTSKGLQHIHLRLSSSAEKNNQLILFRFLMPALKKPDFWYKNQN